MAFPFTKVLKGLVVLNEMKAINKPSFKIVFLTSICLKRHPVKKFKNKLCVLVLNLGFTMLG